MAFNDLLFNILVGFVFLFVVAFLMINPVAKQGDILTKAEFVIQLTWDENRVEDIDLWVQRDDNTPVSYRDKKSNEMHLERDDLGTKNDTVIMNGSSVTILNNSETVTIRGIVPGDYYVGVHYYSEMTGYKKHAERSDPVDIEATVTITKINPFSIVYHKKILLQREGDKANIIGFTVDEDGYITDRFDHSRNLGPSKKENNNHRPNQYNRATSYTPGN